MVIVRVSPNFPKETFKHCKDAAESQLSRIEEDLFLPPMENTASSPDANGTDAIKSPTSSKMSKVGTKIAETCIFCRRILNFWSFFEVFFMSFVLRCQ